MLLLSLVFVEVQELVGTYNRTSGVVVVVVLFCNPFSLQPYPLYSSHCVASEPCISHCVASNPMNTVMRGWVSLIDQHEPHSGGRGGEGCGCAAVVSSSTALRLCQF